MKLIYSRLFKKPAVRLDKRVPMRELVAFAKKHNATGTKNIRGVGRVEAFFIKFPWNPTVRAISRMGLRFIFQKANFEFLSEQKSRRR